MKSPYFIFQENNTVNVDLETYTQWMSENCEKYTRTDYYPLSGRKIQYWVDGDGVADRIRPTIFHGLRSDMTSDDYQMLIDREIVVEGVNLFAELERVISLEEDTFYGSDYQTSFRTWEEAITDEDLLTLVRGEKVSM
ncbi:MAG TPA: hypothetical protein VGE44_14510 [Daejeonella sp.]|uniref:hypothetical protein n=1 Tax=Daejeonella sp. TaxID=2805397 RepID=UPI002ED84488